MASPSARRLNGAGCRRRPRRCSGLLSWAAPPARSSCAGRARAPADRGHDLAAFRHDGRRAADHLLRSRQLRPLGAAWRPAARLPELRHATRARRRRAAAKRQGDAKPPGGGRGLRRPGLLDLACPLSGHPAHRLRLPDARQHPAGRAHRWHVLWERVSGTLPRGRSWPRARRPGRCSDCRTRAAGGWRRPAGVAYVRPEPVVPAGPCGDRHRRGSRRRGQAVSGQSRYAGPAAARGTWDISLRWFSDVPLSLRAGSLTPRFPRTSATRDVRERGAGR